MITATVLTAEEYEERKQFLEELKNLVKSEQEAVYQILRTGKADFSENSNGIFFDVSKVARPIFQKIRDYMLFCKKNRIDFNAREEDERKAQDLLIGNEA